MKFSLSQVQNHRFEAERIKLPTRISITMQFAYSLNEKPRRVPTTRVLDCYTNVQHFQTNIQANVHQLLFSREGYESVSIKYNWIFSSTILQCLWK